MASIIKAYDLRSDEHGVQRVTFNLSDISDQAGDYVDAARREAATILAEAKQQAAEIRQRAEADGKQTAVTAAQKAVRDHIEKQLGAVTPALRQAVEEIRQARGAWVQQWESNLVHLATAIAQRVIRRELKQTPEITLDLIRESLELAAGSGEIELHLNPGDYEKLGEAAGRLAAEFGSLSPARIVSDKNVSPGGCRVETRFGAIDQQIEGQLARIESELNSK